MYYLSLCCIIKDESNLEEFIIYYTLLGVQHFYIYDNESSFPIKERLNNFFYKHYCTIIDYPGKCKQIEAYNDCVKNYGKNTEWLIIVDGDEYILPKVDDTLVNFLKKREYAQAIAINWVFFGTSFHNVKQCGFLVDNYRHCSSCQNDHIKTIVKTKYFKYMENPHYVFVEDQNKIVDSKGNIVISAFNKNYTIDMIQINHYTFKSLEDCNEKHYRGNADSLNRRNIFDKSIHQNFNEMVDHTLPSRYLSMILTTYLLTCINLFIYKALNPELSFLNTEDEIARHVIQYGIRENRPLHIKDKFPDYSRDQYRKDNPQLSHLDDVYLEIDYIHTH